MSFASFEASALLEDLSGHGKSPEWRVQLLVHFGERDEARAFLQSIWNSIALKYFSDDASIMDIVILQAGKFRMVGRMSA